MKKIFSAVLVVLLTGLILSGCSRPATRYSAQFLNLFDTLTQIIAYMDSKEEFSGYATLIHDEMEVYHQLYDIYNDYPGISNLKTINDNAGIRPVKVDRKIIDLLLFARQAYEETDGQVNVALGPVLEIWHQYREEGIQDPKRASLPPLEMLREAAEHTDIRKIIIDEGASTVFLEEPEMRLDVGAIAKGYAVERVARTAMEAGFTSGLISGGGNVRIIGSKNEQGEKWNLGVQNPDAGRGEDNLYVVYLTDSSLVTSGNYERYYTVNGKQYHHIINPETLFPSEYYEALTVIHPDSGMADVLSTALYNVPLEEGLAVVEALEDTEALWIMADGSHRYSSGFQDLLTP